MKKVLILMLSLLVIACAPPEGCKKKTSAQATVVKPEVKTEEVAAVPAPQPQDVLVEDDEPKIPKTTKFKVGDWVCMDGRYYGVVSKIYLATVPDGHDPVLVYTLTDVVNYRSGRAVEDDDGDFESDYYETQLERGKCN